jgi:hypothetical protein
MLRKRSEMLNEFVPVDRGHHDVADYKIGILRLRDGQAFLAVTRLDYAIAAWSKQGDVQPPAGSIIIDDQNIRHSWYALCLRRDSRGISRLENRFSFQEGGEAIGAANCSQEAPGVCDRTKLGSDRRRPLTFIPDGMVSNKGLPRAGVV